MMTKGTLLRRIHLLQQQLLVQSSGLQYHSRHALSSLSTTTTHITSLHQQKQQQQQQFTTLLQNNTNNSNMSIKPTAAATSSCCNYSSTSPSLTEAAAAAAEAATTESSSTPSVDASNDAENQKQPATLSSPKLQKLYDRIIKLSEEEVNILGALTVQVLGLKIFPGEFGGGGGGGVPGGVAFGGAGEAGEAATEVEEKTSFDVKLVGFDAKAKIKVIKEVRAIAGLGLKEAKELVESVPKVIQKGLKQDKAEELKAALEAIGAQIEIV